MYKHLKVTQVYARSLNHCIGIHNRLPWECPADMKHFRTLTRGQIVIMGRKTFESLPKPLTKRHLVIVVSSDPTYINRLKDIPNHTHATSVIAAMDIATLEPKHDVFLIGGRSIYLEALDFTDVVQESVIGLSVKGDTFIDWEIPEHIEVYTTFFKEGVIARAPLII